MSAFQQSLYQFAIVPRRINSVNTGVLAVLGWTGSDDTEDNNATDNVKDTEGKKKALSSKKRGRDDGNEDDAGQRAEAAAEVEEEADSTHKKKKRKR